MVMWIIYFLFAGLTMFIVPVSYVPILGKVVGFFLLVLAILKILEFISGKKSMADYIGMSLGLLAGLQVQTVDTLVGLHKDPLDEVLGNHRVVDGADIDNELVAVHGDDGQVLLAAGVHGVGLERFHLLAAAGYGNAGVMDLHDDVAAVTADINLGFHFLFPP